MATITQRFRAFLNPPPVKAGYAAAETTVNRRSPSVPLRAARLDMAKWTRERIMALARELERNDALVNRFLDLLEQYAIGPHGLRITPASRDGAWNEAALEELARWSPNADLVTRADWAGVQSLASRLWAVDGDCFINLTYSPESGYPRVQVIEAHQIQTPQDYKGDKIIDGVEVNDFGRPVFYHVAPEKDYRGSVISGGVIVPADMMVHIIDPSRAGQYRGVSLFHPVINDLLDLQELQALEMLAAKDNARVSKVVKTSSGEVDDDYSVGGSLRRSVTDGASGEPDKTVYYRDVLGAETVVMRTGDEYQQHQSSRPSVAVQQFWDYVSARAMAGAGLPVEIIIMRSLQGTMTRAALDMANGWFRSRSAVLANHYSRVVRFVIEAAVNRGDLKSPPRDWTAWRYTPPRSVNVDVGRNSAALINEYKTGMRTLENICAEYGWDWREMLDQKAKEMAYAKELADKYGLDRAELIQLDPNELSKRAETATAEEPEDDTEEGDDADRA